MTPVEQDEGPSAVSQLAKRVRPHSQPISKASLNRSVHLFRNLVQERLHAAFEVFSILWYFKFQFLTKITNNVWAFLFFFLGKLP